MKRIIIIFIASLMIVAGCAIIAHGQESSIEITTDADSISVVESLPIDVTSGETFDFWIQNGATDISILIDGDIIGYESIGDNTYSCNISGLNLTDGSIIQVTYSLDKDTSEFEKTLLYDISSLAITFDGKEIFTGSNLKLGSSINVALQKETPSQTITKTVETIPIWYYIIIIILIILLIVALMSSSRKQKTTKKKEIAGGSEELLATKKTLLMSLLKDIEKQHRSKQISDDTYHKLKEQYKQQAVETMKKLEDMKSKIK